MRPLFLLALTTLAPASVLMPGGWTGFSPLPGPRAHHMVAVSPLVPAALFVFGGQQSPGSQMEPVCLRYSLAGDTWVERSAMERGRGIGRAVAVKGIIYVLGGCRQLGQGLRTVESYDPLADTWDSEAPMPESLHDFAGAAWRDSLIYVFGGGNWAPQSPPGRHVWIFDPRTGSWQAATELPLRLGASAAGISGDTIVIATGWTPAGPTNWAWRGIIDSTRPTSIAWEALDTLPGPPRCRSVSGVQGPNLLVSGGILDNGTVTDESWLLDVRTGDWTRAESKPTPVAGVCGSAALYGLQHVPGGYPGTAPYVADHEALRLASMEHDVGVSALTGPLGRLRPDTDYPVQVGVENSGSSAEVFGLRLLITDTLTGQFVFGKDSTVSLAPAESLFVELGQFTPGAGRVYLVHAYTMLPGDQNPFNDSGYGSCRTTLGSDPDAYGYVYESTQDPDTVSFSWFVPVNTDTIRNWFPDPDDGVSLRTLPFPFIYYGDTVRQLYVCTNGFLSTSDRPYHENRRLPMPELTDLIAPFWDDLTLRESGFVLERRLPDRAVYTWQDVERYTDDERLTFQVVIYRGGNIRFNYLDVDADASGATIAIQGRNGASGWYQQYVHDGLPQQHVPVDSTTILFHSPDAGVEEESPASRSGFGPRLEVPAIARRTSIALSAHPDGPGVVRLHDVTGALRSSLVLPAGASSMLWTPLDRNGATVPPGTYFVSLVCGSGRVARRLLLLP